MNYPEIIKLSAEIVTAIFTAALFYATLTLAKHTKLMSDRDAEQRRISDLKRCIELAELIARLDERDFGNWLAGEWSSRSIRPFNELLTLKRYLHDAEIKRMLEYITSVLDVELLQRTNTKFSSGPLKEEMDKLRFRLPQEIIELQKKLGNYV